MQSNEKTAWAAKTSVFLTVFGTLCISFEPTMAFALALVALVAVKNF